MDGQYDARCRVCGQPQTFFDMIIASAGSQQVANRLLKCLVRYECRG